MAELDARAKLTGVDYDSRFEVPVFKTAESREGFNLDEKLVKDYAGETDRGMLLAAERIRKSPFGADGVGWSFRRRKY